MNNTVLACRSVSKSYRDGELHVDVLDSLNFDVAEGQSVSIIGASGSGKSTLLHILGGLDMPTSGSVNLMGNDLGKMSQKQLGDLRNRYLALCINSIICCPNFRRWKM